ncbi:gluconate:H+ symporter [Verrucomicrobiales bacterium BCK34]|nr:gluconate:H+ symporter [Verrucomicrobiales bacterium BCK34]
MTLLPTFLAAAEAPAHGLGYLLGVLGAAIVLLLVMILGLRLQAFIALIIASLFVAIAAGMPLGDIPDTIVKGMGGALGFIATIIGLGAIFGQILENSGGAKTLANSLVNLFGQKRASWAMLLTGFLISIPVFLDVGLVIVAPIIYALARDTKKSLLLFGLPLVCGMAVTHAFVPPTPGPVAVAEILGADLGRVILYGIGIGLPTAIIVGIFMVPKICKNINVEIPAFFEEAKESGPLPNFGLVAFIMGLPIVLIVLGSTWAKADDPGSVQTLVGFLGHPVVALLLATLLALLFLGVMRGVSKDKLLDLSTKALGPAGIIILITGAGGVFKQILGASGVGDALADWLGSYGISAVVLAYLFSMIVRVAQGSATVAMITAAGLMAGIVQAGDFSPSDLALIVIAIAAGSTMLSHVNDSGFWIISRYLGMNEAQTLKTWTVLSVAISLIGFLFTVALSYIV